MSYNLMKSIKKTVDLLFKIYNYIHEGEKKYIQFQLKKR